MTTEQPNPDLSKSQPALSELDRFNLLYFVVVIAVIVICRRRIPNWQFCLALYTGIGLALLVFLKTTARRRKSVAGFIRDWYLPLLFLLHYEATYWLNQSFAPLLAPWISRVWPGIALVSDHLGDRVYFDMLFVPLDDWLFGCQPSIRFAHVFHWPWFGEIMHLAYFSFYGYPVVVGSVLWLRNKRADFDRMMFRAALTMWSCYLFFIVVPTAGPRQFLGPGGFNLHGGYLFTGIMKFLLEHGEVATGAFPSSHVAVALVIWLSAYRPERRLFVWLIVPFIALCLSTVYLAEHYAVDVFAGLAVGIVFYVLSERVRGFFRPGQSGAGR